MLDNAREYDDVVKTGMEFSVRYILELVNLRREKMSEDARMELITERLFPGVILLALELMPEAG